MSPTTVSLDSLLTPLQQADFQKLFAPGHTIYRGVKARLLMTPVTPSPGFVRVRATDFFNVDARIEIDFQIDNNLK